MRVAIQSIHRYPTPTLRLISAPRRSGMGQGPGGAATCAQYIANAFAGLPSAAEAAMLLNTGSPSGAVLSALYITGGSPAEAAQNIVTQLAQEYCGAVQAEISSGDPNAASPPDCGDGGASCAAAAYPRWLAYYSSLPASVWSTGMVSPQVANPQAFPTAVPVVAPPPPSPPDTTLFTVYGPPPAGTPAAQQIQQNTPTPPPPSPPSPFGSGASAPAAGTSSGTGSGTSTSGANWFTETSFDGIPNWALVAGGVGLVLLAMSMMGGRR